MLLTKRLAIIPLFSAIAIFSCQEPLSVKTQEQLNISLGLKEKKVPTEHLSLESFSLVPKTKNSTENAGVGMLAVGILKNTANAVAFIDVEVELSFISEAKTVVDIITIILFNYYEPNTESIFSINIEDCPKATLGYSAKIIGAEGIIN
jgi:hypothetical protein